MVGSESPLDGCIIFTPRIAVSHYESYRSPKRTPVGSYPRQDLHLIRFLALRDSGGMTGAPARHITPHRVKVYKHKGRHPVKDATHCRPVAFAKSREPYQFSYAVHAGSDLSVHRHKKFRIVARHLHPLLYELHGFHRIHVGEVVAQDPHPVERLLREEKVIAARGT